MAKTADLNSNVQDASWLVKLSDADYEKMKARFADFSKFAFRALLKEMVKMGMLMGDDFSGVEEFKNSFIKELVTDMVNDGSLPKSALDELK